MRYTALRPLAGEEVGYLRFVLPPRDQCPYRFPRYEGRQLGGQGRMVYWISIDLRDVVPIRNCYARFAMGEGHQMTRGPPT